MDSYECNLMKYVSEFRDAHLVEGVIGEIKRTQDMLTGKKNSRNIKWGSDTREYLPMN